MILGDYTSLLLILHFSALAGTLAGLLCFSSVLSLELEGLPALLGRCSLFVDFLTFLY